MSQPPSFGNIGLTSSSDQYFKGTKPNDLVMFSYSNASAFVGQSDSNHYVKVDTNGISMVASNVTAIAPFASNNPGVVMTAYATSNAAGAYYVASASTESNSSVRAWYAFDGLPLTYWQASNAFYSAAGAYIGSNTTFFNVNSSVSGIGVVSSGSVSGEWLQIQMPTGILATSATITSSNAATTPAKVTLLSSHDGSTWDFVASNADVNTDTTLTLTAASNAVSGNIFRLVTSSNVGATSPAIVNFNIAGSPKPFATTDAGAVGIGVDEPVQALEVAGNVVCSGSVSAGNLGMFRNRIINGNFMIDQRGSATTPVGTNGEYGPDRFNIQVSAGSTGYTISQYPMTVASDRTVMKAGFAYGVKVNTGTRTAGNVTDMHQYIELCNCIDLLSGSVTISFWARSSVAGSVYLSLNTSTDGTKATLGGSPTITIPLGTTWQYYKQTLAINVINTGALTSYGMDLCFSAGNAMSSGAMNFYTGIQVEKGTIATPFEFRPYQWELQLCQRYFETSSWFRTIGSGAWSAGNTFMGANVFFKVSKRNTSYLLRMVNKDTALSLLSTGTWTNQTSVHSQSSEGTYGVEQNLFIDYFYVAANLGSSGIGVYGIFTFKYAVFNEL